MTVEIIKTRQELDSTRSNLAGPIGLVPTMGNLHLGHISLLEASLKDCDNTFITIFVNPKQFGPNEDFNRYPRTLEADIELIKNKAQSFNKNIYIFAPQNPEEIYDQHSNYEIEVIPLSSVLEGHLRPGHFRGVATVVYKLFDLIKPNKAYFGLKDYQQLLVIKNMVKDLLLPIEIIPMEIIREPSGLALSSRNQYLSQEQRDQSLILSLTLNHISNIIENTFTNLDKAQVFISKCLIDKNWNYLEIRDGDTLEMVSKHTKNIVILGVYQLGTTRLLDNKKIELKKI